MNARHYLRIVGILAVVTALLLFWAVYRRWGDVIIDLHLISLSVCITLVVFLLIVGIIWIIHSYTAMGISIAVILANEEEVLAVDSATDFPAKFLPTKKDGAVLRTWDFMTLYDFVSVDSFYAWHKRIQSTPTVPLELKQLANSLAEIVQDALV